MGQAKARRAAEMAGRPWRERPHGDIPKELIARAVREPLLQDVRLRRWDATGSCVQQAEVGRRLLVNRYGLDVAMFVGDFMRPMADGSHHTYTREDGRISIETGACHAWLFCKATGEYIDFAAWETPRRMEAQGVIWLGPRPDYLWETLPTLKARGYIAKVDMAATASVAMHIRRGKDADFLDLYQRSALAVLDEGMQGLRSTRYAPHSEARK